MSPMPYATEKRRALTAIFIVFLFIFSEILVAENGYQVELNDKNNAEYAIFQYAVNAETYIDSADFDSNLLSSSQVLISESSSSEKRGLYRFTNNLTAMSDSVISAELKLTCDVLSETVSGVTPVLYLSLIHI